MQFVSDKWYDWYSRAITAISGILFVATALKMFMFPDFDTGNRWGLSYLTLLLSAIHVIYGLVIYGIVRRRTSAFGATLAGNFIFLANIVNLLQSTGQLRSVYEILWIFVVFCAGIFGPYSIMAFCFLSVLYLIILVTKTPGEIIVDPYNLLITTAVFLTGTASYYFWRNKYVDAESEKIAQLSGQLKSSKLQFEALFSALSDGVIATDTDGKITHINPAAATMTGWVPNEALGIAVKSVLKVQDENGKELDENETPIKEVLKTSQQATATLRLLNKQNAFIIVSVVVSPVIPPKSNKLLGIVAVFRDVSTAHAEENRRADFVSTASHEMRTPVAAIEGYLQLALNEKVTQIDAKARGFLEKALESTHHLGKLFQDLLTSAKAEDGRLVSHPVVVELGEFLSNLSDGYKFAAEKKGLLMDYVIGAGQQQQGTGNTGGARVIKPLYYVHVDPDRLREVITNLFDNGVKYTDSGKITMAITGNNEVVQLFIKDTGPGIPADDIPHLFQKFYRVDSSVTRTIGGTGLGLFICRKIIELYHGRIWVESAVGKGSTFYINLPRLSTQKALELQSKEAKQII